MMPMESPRLPVDPTAMRYWSKKRAQLIAKQRAIVILFAATRPPWLKPLGMSQHLAGCRCAP